MKDVEDANPDRRRQRDLFEQIHVRRQCACVYVHVAVRCHGQPVEHGPQRVARLRIAEEAYDHGGNGGGRKHRLHALPERVDA